MIQDYVHDLLQFTRWALDRFNDAQWQGLGAIATFVAVVAALWLAGAEKRQRTADENALALMIAVSIYDEIGRIMGTASMIAERTAPDRVSASVDAVSARLAAMRKIDTTMLDRFASQLHVLGPSCIEIVRCVHSAAALRLLMSEFEEAKSDKATFQLGGANGLNQMHITAKDADAKGIKALSLVRAYLNEPQSPSPARRVMQRVSSYFRKATSRSA